MEIELRDAAFQICAGTVLLCAILYFVAWGLGKLMDRNRHPEDREYLDTDYRNK